MLRKTLLTLSASTMLSAGAIAPNAAHAFGPPPLLGGPPHLPGPNGPAGLSHLGGPGFHGGGHGLQGNVHGLQDHSAAYGHGHTAAYSYGHSARYGYGHGEWRHGHWGRYDVSVDGSDGHDANGYSSANGCAYTYSERRHRRVLVCDAN